MAVRILHIVTYMGRGGLETMLMNYYRHIDREKIQFDFLVHREFEADYDAEIKELGGKIYHISKLVPWSNSYKKKLKSFFMEHPEYKIVHVHQDCLSSVALKCAKECGIQVRIAHSHSSSAVKNIKYFIKLYYMKQIPKYATEMFACGKLAGDWMFCGKDYQIINNAVDIKKYRYSEQENQKMREQLKLNDKVVIGHVGNFTSAKNHEFLLRIFKAIVQKEPNARLLLVGGGENGKKIKKKAKELSIEDKVLFMGVRTDVNKLMQCMDVFVFPSLYEGLPVTIIEAQASGLPCVISDRVSNECIVTKEFVTILKLSDTTEQWAEHVLLRAKQSHMDTSSAIIEAGYDIHTAAKRLENYYLQKYGEK